MEHSNQNNLKNVIKGPFAKVWAGCKETRGAVRHSGTRTQLCLPPVILEGSGGGGSHQQSWPRAHSRLLLILRGNSQSINTLPSLSFNPPASRWCLPWTNSPRSPRAGKLRDVIFSSQHMWQDEEPVCSGRGRAPAQLHPFYPSVNALIFCLREKFLFPSHRMEEVPSARAHC